MSEKGDKELEERLAEVEAENNAIKDYLAKLVENGPSRRQVLKSGATAAGAGMLGFSAGNASAQASTEDGDGNVGDPDNPVDVFADGVAANSVSNIVRLNGRDPVSVIENVPADTLVVCDPSTQHTIDSAINIGSSGVYVWGLNAKLADGANNYCIITNASGITLDNIRIDGNKANQSPSDQRHGIFNSGQADIEIKNFYVANTYDHGISTYTPNAENCTYRNGTIENAGRGGIRGVGSGGVVWDVDIINAGSRVQAGGAIPRGGGGTWYVRVDGSTDSGVTVTARDPGVTIMGYSINNDNNGFETIQATDQYVVNVPWFEVANNGSHGLQTKSRINAENVTAYNNGGAGIKLNGGNQPIRYSSVSGMSYNNGQDGSNPEPYGVAGAGDVTDVVLQVVAWDDQGTATQTTGVGTADSCDYWDLAHSNLRGVGTAHSLVGSNNSTSDVTV